MKKMLKVNEQTVPYQNGIRVIDLVDTYKPGADIFIVNGFPASPDTVLAEKITKEWFGATESKTHFIERI